MAQLDPSIILQDIAPKFESRENMLAKQLQIQGLQQQQQENAFKMQQDRDTYQQQNQLAQLLGRQGFDVNSADGQKELYRTGGVKGAQGVLKSNADLYKTKNDAEKVGLENHIKRFELMGQLMGGVKDQYSYDIARQQAAKIPELADLAPNMPAEFDPARIQQGYQQAMSVKDRMTQRLAEITQAETGRHNLSTEKISVDNNVRTNQTSRANNQASVGATMRGQNMTDARSRESNSASMSKPFEVTGEDGKPVLVRQDKQGNISRVEGFGPKSGAEKPMTDAQSKAALFGSRMEESDKIIQDLAKAGTTKSIPFSNSGFGVGNAVTALSSGSQQQLQQAKRDFINATLRRESGAVISPSEFDNAEKQYFPQIGDEPSVIKQKANNRAIATRGVQAEIPKAQRGVVKEIIGNKAGNIDSLLEKYK